MTKDIYKLGVVNNEAVIVTEEGTILRTPEFNIAEALARARKNAKRTSLPDVSSSNDKTKPVMPKVNPW